MTDKEQTKQFGEELDKLVKRFEDEYELSFAQAVGVMQIKIHCLCEAAMNNSEEES